MISPENVQSLPVRAQAVARALSDERMKNLWRTVSESSPAEQEPVLDRISQVLEAMEQRQAEVLHELRLQAASETAALKQELAAERARAEAAEKLVNEVRTEREKTRSKNKYQRRLQNRSNRRK